MDLPRSVVLLLPYAHLCRAGGEYRSDSRHVVASCSRLYAQLADRPVINRVVVWIRGDYLQHALMQQICEGIKLLAWDRTHLDACNG